MKLSANSYAGRKHERAIANLLDMAIPGPRFPTTERELLALYDPGADPPERGVKAAFCGWIGVDRARIAGGASAVAQGYDLLRRRMAYAADYKSVINMHPDAAIDRLDEIAAAAACALERGQALTMINDFAKNGVGQGRGVTVDVVLWGATYAIAKAALDVFGIDVWAGGWRSSGVDELRDKYALPPLRRRARKGWRSVWDLR
jgi:hypothetical protein